MTALKANLPNDFNLSETWIREYNASVRQIANAFGTNLDEFKVSDDQLKRSIASGNYLTGEVKYRKGQFCERHFLLHKMDALLTYFTGLQGGQDRQIGFRRR